MNERNIGRWSFAVALGGLILVLVFIVTRLTHSDNPLVLVVLGFLCGLEVCLGALIGWKELWFDNLFVLIGTFMGQ